MSSTTLPPCVEHKLAIEDNKLDKAVDKADRVQRGQWLRAAILGSNDGLLSTTSLMLGMAAASEDKWDMMLAGLAAAVAGACSMAVGEYVSVATQRDIERADNADSDSQMSEQQSIMLQLIRSPFAKAKDTSTTVPVSPAVTPKRRSMSASHSPGISPAMRSVFMSPKRSPMMRVISVDAREEMNSDGYDLLPNPVKAGAASALAFLCGAIIPLLSAVFVNNHLMRTILLVVVTTIALAVFGGVGAHLGGSPVGVSATRVLVGGWAAMGISYGLLKPFDNKHEGKEARDVR